MNQLLAATGDIVVDAPKRADSSPIGYSNLGAFISNALVVVFSFALLFVLIMLIWGAFEWISSGGDKEAVGKARGRIINALIGLAILAVAYALVNVAGQFLGFDVAGGKLNIIIPTPPKP